MKTLPSAMVAVLLTAAFVNPASGQYRPPGGPTLPTELEYFRPQQGVLDNYNQFVAPRYQLANQLRTMQQDQRTSFRALEERIQQSDQIRQPAVAPTGTAAGFMNYSHYYRGGAARGGRR
jgi:hypothetical protein